MRTLTTVIRSIFATFELISGIFFAFGDKEKLTIAGYKFRKFFENIGGVYVKFGQILALRKEVLPLEVCNELRKLLDEVPPFDFAFVEKYIQEDFQKKPEEIFSSIDSTPLASASLGQVHKATLKTGEEVVIKILRPNVKEHIKADMKLLNTVANILDFIPLMRVKIKDIVREFEVWMNEETDYLVEAKNLEEFYNFKSGFIPVFNIPLRTKLPKVYKQYSSSRILVMEFIKGLTLNQIIKIYQSKDQQKIQELESKGFNRKEIGRTINLLEMKQCFIDGLFNGDPHPANIIVNEKNEVYFIDFGLIGRLNKKKRVANLRFFRSLAFLDKDGALEAFKSLLDTSKINDENKLRRAIEQMVNKVKEIRDNPNKTYGDASQTALFSLLKILYGLKIQISPDVAKALRAMATVDGIVSALNPDITTSEATQDVLRVTLAATYVEVKDSLNQETLTKILLKGINLFEKEILLD